MLGRGFPRFNEALTHLNAGRYPLAVDAADAHTRQHPAHAEGWSILGAALLSLGRTTDARRASVRAAELNPRDPRPHQQIAASLMHEGRFSDMKRALDRGIRACGRDPLLVGLSAERLHAMGDYEGAYQEARPLIASAGRSVGLVVAFARSCGQTGRGDEGAAALQAFLARDDLTPMARASAAYALGEVLDRLGRYDEAFAAAKTANDLKNRFPDPEEQSRAVDVMLGAWTKDAVRALPQGPRTELPVFIVGFWRSGTTLVEQVLSSHPAVHGAGELPLVPAWVHERHDPRLIEGEPLLTDLSVLTRPVLERFSRNYMAHIRRLAPRAERITDKMPVNFVHLGLLSRAFPGARVVRCTRSAADTCLSCYFNLHGNILYAHDLRALGSFYRDYERIMQHWKGVLDISLLEVRYEDFVVDQEAQTRRLVEFTGLPWDEACLRPHENSRIALTRSMDQVRRPLYASSVARWKRYEKHLGPLLEALGTGGPP